jgi:hypothetical protein
VLDSVREQLAVGAIIPRLDALCARWKPILWVGVEANGFQVALVNEARSSKYRNIPTVCELDHEGKGKLTRATPAILRAEQGQIFLPQEAPWLDEWEGETCQFTGDEKLDAYTDQTDGLAYYVLHSKRLGEPQGMPILVADAGSCDGSRR